MSLKKPIKPIHPILVDPLSEVSCVNFCDNGEDSEYTGVGNDRWYYKCMTCRGTGKSTGKEKNEYEMSIYNRQLEKYNRELEIQKVLKTIRLSKNQREALRVYGFDKYIKETT